MQPFSTKNAPCVHWETAHSDLQFPAVVVGVDVLHVVEDHAVHGSTHPRGGADEQLARDVRDGVATLVAPVHVS